MAASYSFYGAPGEIRTPGLLIRSKYLYSSGPESVTRKAFAISRHGKRDQRISPTSYGDHSRHFTAFDKALGSILGQCNIAQYGATYAVTHWKNLGKAAGA